MKMQWYSAARLILALSLAAWTLAFLSLREARAEETLMLGKEVNYSKFIFCASEDAITDHAIRWVQDGWDEFLFTIQRDDRCAYVSADQYITLIPEEVVMEFTANDLAGSYTMYIFKFRYTELDHSFFAFTGRRIEDAPSI